MMMDMDDFNLSFLNDGKEEQQVRRGGRSSTATAPAAV
jgi:hypothetical protein